MIKNFTSRIRLYTIFFLSLIMVSARGQITFPSNSAFRYLKGSQAQSLTSSWKDPGYNDAAWSMGSSPFWYGDGSGGTEITDMQNNYLTFYLRTTFNASNVENIQEANFSINYDDGFALWINGEEVLNQYAPASFAYNDSATDLHESGTFEQFVVSGNDLNLTEGTNTLAIQCFNANYSSSDFHFNMSLDALTTTPVLQDTVGISYSLPSGYYESAFTLTLTSPDPAAEILYTIDGSNPQVSTSAQNGGTSVNILVDPSITSGRGATPAFVVRASLTKAGYQPSYPSGRTYIFFNALLSQGYPGNVWPSGNVIGVTYPGDPQIIDYNMDPDIINDSRYTNLMRASFTDIPTMSVITSAENLFDPNTGIYVNAAGHGIEWERECTFEMFDPEGDEEGFSVNAGVRIRGGYSRHPWYPKHAFRVFFRSEYGDAKLNYPLFGDEGVDTYDKIDLRTSQNYAWSLGDSRNTMVREVFSRDMQRDMGQPYTRSRYYHLFINGMYWGLYQTQERSEARFASDYFGDSSEDYDVVKVSTENWSYQVEATDGSTESWREVYNRAQAGFAENEDYFALEAKDSWGKPLPGEERLIEIDNLIDYMLTIFYAGNFDAPTSSFGGNEGPNNFYAIYNRSDMDKGFMFFNHDAEHSLFYYDATPGIGINENRVNLGTRSDDLRMNVSSFYGFHPQWLHFKLSENEEYRMRFADRAVMYLSEGGVLSPEKCTERFQARADQIDMAIIAESARWGDQGGGTPLNRNDHWLPQINHTNNLFFPARTDITITQLRDAGLYPNVDAPEIYRNDVLLTEQEYDINPGWIISLENPETSGTLYYTLDGTDPRKTGGDIRESAHQGHNQNVMTLTGSTIIKARVYQSGEWSGLRQIRFFAPEQDFSKLKVTEIAYHPVYILEGPDTVSGKSFEFIEFKNTGTRTLNLSGVTIDSAVYLQIPPKTLLAPGQFYVLVSKPSNFFQRYALKGSGNFSGNLANSGERILVTDPSGGVIMDFTYDDQAPWPELPDGDGPTLVSADMDPTGSPGNPEYWRASFRDGGSPFANDYLYDAIGEQTHPVGALPELMLFPNPSSDQLNIQLSYWDPDEQVRLGLYQLDGRVLTSMDIHSDLCLSLGRLNIESGVYLLRLEGKNWKQTRRVIYSK
ncbi:MAG: CotH kinase family protein [Bacteroidales bacterium]|nr:CotH kinase family protein [Bacteroidales bacterium]